MTDESQTTYDVTTFGVEHDLPAAADRFLDRELSWLAFNERVLDMAADTTLPLLERTNFLSIFASNLDEFFMVRVAGLKRRISTGLAVPSVTGTQPRTAMRSITKTARGLVRRHAELYRDDIMPRLEAEGIYVVGLEDLTESELDGVSELFSERVFPVLTPLAVDPAHPFPYVSGLSLNLGVVLRHPRSGAEHFARVKVPPVLPRFINVSEFVGPGASAALAPGAETPVSPETPARFLPIEDVITAHLDSLFEGMEIVSAACFRITRNEDLEVEEDDAENLLKALEKELERRRFGPAVRLEITEDMHPRVRELLVNELAIDESEIYELPTPLDLRGLDIIADIPREDLHFRKAVPIVSRDLAEAESSDQPDVFGALRDREILVQHPYESFSTSVQAFIEQAAADPHVVAIKQSLYRTSGDSPIVDALIEAAQAGKQVLAVVEIKARFDEANNITWARKLERAGVHVVYGIVGLKTHAKLCLVVRHEAGGLRRYCHVGTGNYHPKTARGYEDMGLLTADPQLGADIAKLFNQLSGLAPGTTYSRLLVAPARVRDGLLEHIDEAAARARAGERARIRIKVNSIVDERIIDHLYLASRAGVSVQLFVRGICAIRPGIPGLSENIQVRSILGRFLEHSRVFVFESGEDYEHTEAYIGSADLMHRNLDRRVEALVQLQDPRHISEARDLFELAFADDTARFDLDGEGLWTRTSVDAHGAPLADYQTALHRIHRRRWSRQRG
ncbi:RNA degradosome polyphosphate kinase [Brevibacterium yomogidense]|uniref:Polyphosphate kinase n=1 Tax=Brevibacterium yomogidense TaxID=946573 RepID=A0A1X6XMQ5_9MICO|nr:RNA degradosome polyphosphate kinase [Brevibacterium yomogidense]SLN00625.1 Polyphosphate kinase [Brevibacterium yomogidense]